MSPESVFNGLFNTTMSIASDIWSAGILFYSWMTGNIPKQSNNAINWMYKLGCTIDPQGKSYGLSGIELLGSSGGLSNTSVVINIQEKCKQWYDEAMKLLIQMTRTI